MALKSFGQLMVEGATLAGIVLGAKNATDKYNRAQSALKLVPIFQSVSNSGDVMGAIAQAQALLLTSVKDPGEAAFLQGLLTIGNAQLQVVLQAESAVPLLNPTVVGVAQEIAAGITEIANQYKAPAVA